MGYREVMSMPMRAFWIVSGFVDRLMSDEAKLHLEVAASAQSGEAAWQLMERLNTVAPEPVTLSGYALAQRAKLPGVEQCMLYAMPLQCLQRQIDAINAAGGCAFYSDSVEYTRQMLKAGGVI